LASRGPIVITHTAAEDIHRDVGNHQLLRAGQKTRFGVSYLPVCV